MGARSVAISALVAPRNAQAIRTSTRWRSRSAPSAPVDDLSRTVAFCTLASLHGQTSACAGFRHEAGDVAARPGRANHRRLMRYLAEVGAKIQENHRHTGMLPCTIDREDQVDQERVAYPSSCQRPSREPAGDTFDPAAADTRGQDQHDVAAYPAGRVLERGRRLDHAAQTAVFAVPHVGRAVAHFAQRHADRIERRQSRRCHRGPASDRQASGGETLSGPPAAASSCRAAGRAVTSWAAASRTGIKAREAMSDAVATDSRQREKT